MTRLLLVEDNPFDVQLLRLAFDTVDWPLDITVANDGKKALTLIAQAASNPEERADLVLLDFNLPCHDGTEILKAIRQTRGISGIPVVILSSSPTDLVRKKLDEAGVAADGHLTKPCGLNEFLELGAMLYICYTNHQLRNS